MNDAVGISDRYAEALPDGMLDDYRVKSAYVAKLGFIRQELNYAFREKLFSEEEGSSGIDEVVDELYRLLESSPHVMSVTPSISDMKDKVDNGGVPLRVWGYQRSVALGEFIQLRVVLSQKKRDELFRMLPWTWEPEEFSVWFDGSIFVAQSQVDAIPVSTHLGQLAREFLRETCSDSVIWKQLEGTGPTPIHPEIYIISVERNDLESESSMRLPFVTSVGRNIVVVADGSGALDTAMAAVLRDASFALESFYHARIASRDYDEAADNVDKLNSQLGAQLSSYFQLSTYRRLFSPDASSIRRTLANMHYALHLVSEKQSELKRAQTSAIKWIGEANLLDVVQGYFEEHVEADSVVDRESHLTLMNFAAEETNATAITQATLVAALVGAVIGGLIAVAGQAWL